MHIVFQDYTFSIDLKVAYLHISFVKYHHFLWFVWQHEPYQWKILPFGLATVAKVSISLTKPILVLCQCKGFDAKIYLDYILVLTCSKYAGKRAWVILCCLLVCLGLHINFSNFELCLTVHFAFFKTMLGYSGLLSDKPFEIQQLTESLLQRQPVTIHLVMSSLGMTTIVPMDKHNSAGYGASFRMYVECLPFPVHLCFPFSLSFSSSMAPTLGDTQLQQSSVPLQFPLPDVGITTDAIPKIWPSISGYSVFLSCSGIWSGSICKVHIALQDL